MTHEKCSVCEFACPCFCDCSDCGRQQAPPSSNQNLLDHAADLEERNGGSCIVSREIREILASLEWHKAEIERLQRELADAQRKVSGVGFLAEVVAERDRLRAVVEVAREECSRQGCHCPGEIKGECSFCRIGTAIAGLPPSETSAKPPCDHPLGKLFYHGFVSGRPGDFRCDACQAVIYLPSLKAREWAAARIEMQQQSKTSGTQNAASGHECQHCKQLNADWAKWCGRCGGSLRD